MRNGLWIIAGSILISLCIFAIQSTTPDNKVTVKMATKGRSETRDSMISQILGPTVKVITNNTLGTGIIIYRSGNTYRAITNNHVVEPSIINMMPEVDGILGKVTYKNPAISIEAASIGEFSTFSDAIIIGLEPMYDLALLEFDSPEELSVATLAPEEIFSTTGLFDEIYATGCHFGEAPIVEKGIISGSTERSGIPLLITDTPLSPGASGGAVFIERDGQYYVLSINRSIQMETGMLFPHYAMSIAPGAIHAFLCQCSFEIENLSCGEIK